MTIPRTAKSRRHTVQSSYGKVVAAGVQIVVRLRELLIG